MTKGWHILNLFVNLRL